MFDFTACSNCVLHAFSVLPGFIPIMPLNDRTAWKPLREKASAQSSPDMLAYIMDKQNSLGSLCGSDTVALQTIKLSLLKAGITRKPKYCFLCLEVE